MLAKLAFIGLLLLPVFSYANSGLDQNSKDGIESADNSNSPNDVTDLDCRLWVEAGFHDLRLVRIISDHETDRIKFDVDENNFTPHNRCTQILLTNSEMVRIANDAFMTGRQVTLRVGANFWVVDIGYTQ